MRAISGARREAFFRARSTLIRAGKQGYAEQFQGLYAMMGGLVVALVIGSFYFAGWAGVSAGYRPNSPIAVETGLVSVALLLAILSQRTAENARRPWERALAGVLALASLWGGVVVARGTLTGLQATAGKEENGCAVLKLENCRLTVIAGEEGASANSAHNRLAAETHGNLAWVMALLALGNVIIAVRFFGSYRFFAREFALNVWRDFGDL